MHYLVVLFIPSILISVTYNLNILSIYFKIIMHLFWLAFKMSKIFHILVYEYSNSLSIKFAFLIISVPLLFWMCTHICWVTSVVSNSLYPLDCSPPGSSVRGILQARILKWVAIPFSRESSLPRDRTRAAYVFCIAGRFLTISPTCRALWMCMVSFLKNTCVFLFIYHRFFTHNQKFTLHNAHVLKLVVL